MTRLHTLPAAALLAASPALADVDASAVWADLQAGLAAQGYEVDAGAVDEGAAAVTVTGLVLRMVTDGEGFDDAFQPVATRTVTELTLPALAIVEAGAAATIEFPPTAALSIASAAKGGDPTTVTGTFGFDDMSVDVTEARGGLAYDYRAAAVTFDLGDIVGADEDVPDEVTASARLEDVSGRNLSIQEDGVRRGEQTSRTGPLTMTVRAVRTEGPEAGRFDMALAMDGLSGTGRFVLPEGVDLADLQGAAEAGAVLVGSASFGAGRLELDADIPDGAFAVSADSRGSTLVFEMEDGRLIYGGTGEGGSMTVSGANIPVPEVALSSGGSEFQIDVPLLGAPTPQPLDLRIAIRELTLADAVWGLFDPAGTLDRSPASLSVDLSAEVIAPDGLTAGPEMAEMTPPEPRALTIRELAIGALGATLEARGALSAASGEAEMAPGVPQMAGTIELDATGLEAMLQGLAAAGLIPTEQAAFARGMIGFVARSTGADSYASEIVLGPDGSITANGMPLR